MARSMMLGRPALVVTLTAALLGVTPVPAMAATRFVNCNDGESLQATIDAAAPNDVIIASGLCQGYFKVDKDLTILGFFSVTLDGSTENNAFPVLLIDDGADLVLENVVVTGGLGSFPSHGAGIDVFRGSLALKNAEVYGNNGQVGGGINVFSGASARLEDVYVHDNIAQSLGGGIFNNGTLTVIDSIVHGNHALFGTGGGFFNGGTLTVEDSTIQSNVTPNFGGAVYTTGSATIVRTQMRGNTGGVANDGSLLIHGSSLVDNRASSSASLGYGGGVWNMDDGTATVENSTISGNRAFHGGGVKNDGTATLRAVTVAGNTAFPGSGGATGGGVHNEGSLTIESSVVSGNAGTSPDCVTPSPITSAGHNYVSLACLAVPGSSDLLGTAPGVAAAADNGGPTPTARLLAWSPLVDAGACLFSTDQRGVSRPQHGACDIGAYENRGPKSAGTPFRSAGASPNTGSFSLSWNASVDPDGDSIVYLVERADADDAGYSLVATVLSTTVALTGQPEGTQRYRIVATDGLNPAPASSASTAVVVDRTAPAAPTLTTDRAAEHVADDGALWFRDAITVTVTPGADPLLQDGSTPSGTVTPGSSSTYETPGAHVTSASSADAVGNTSSAASLTVHVDTTAPTVGFDACPTTVLLGAVTTVPWSAADTGVGLAGEDIGTVVLDTSAVGPTTASVEVADLVGHSATADCTSQVVYDFNGFEAPLRSDGTAGTATAGRTLPARFGLGGDQGLDVLAGPPTFVPLDCATREPVGVEAAAASSRGLTYDARKQLYTYWWDTDRSQRMTCARLTVALVDGTTHTAEVDFR